MSKIVVNLVEKALKLASESRPLKKDECIEAQEKLGVCLSEDFSYITKKISYEFLSHFEWYNFPFGVTEWTMELRERGLPHKYVVLSDEGDGGAVFLETQDSPEKPSPVIWCDMEDVYNLCDTGEFKYNPTIWPSFTDFFEYLVDEEEKMQIAENRLDK
jgi:hypothetical protein